MLPHGLMLNWLSREPTSPLIIGLEVRKLKKVLLSLFLLFVAEICGA
jgi:hypothetical protein